MANQRNDRRAGRGCNYCGFRHLPTDGRQVSADEYVAQVSRARAGILQRCAEVPTSRDDFERTARVLEEAGAGLLAYMMFTLWRPLAVSSGVPRRRGLCL